MTTHRSARVILCALGTLLFAPSWVWAHCDGMDGPVVKAAQAALASSNVDLVLVWVPQEDEDAIRQAFDRTMKVRTLSTEAHELADMYFFETVVRLHRAGEGAPYTGLKPAGRDLGPAIPAADRALETREIDPLVNLITEETRKGLTERFDRTVATRGYPTADVDAGREHVEAYVTFIHYVERAYEAAHEPAVGHFSAHEEDSETR